MIIEEEAELKTIGMIGGTGWISTQEYYRHINEMTNAKLGGLNFAKCILYSFNYAQIDSFNRSNDTKGIYDLLLDTACKLETAGAECLVLCANTLHQHAEELSRRISIPIIHIADATAKEINRGNFGKVGLLGTRITMEENFYKSKLNQYNIDVIVPSKDDREFIHETIMAELLKNIIKEKSRDRFLQIIDGLCSSGAQAIILGCTEIPLLIKPGDAPVPMLDTLQIHCRAAVNYSLGIE